MPDKENIKKAIFAGGCFWCMEPAFDQMEGVHSTTPGYMGGEIKNPTYEGVSTGETGHAEVVEVIYDSTKAQYEDLLEVFWRNINPTTPNRQFADKGSQYRTAIFYYDEKQQQLAEASKEKFSRYFSDSIVTEIVPASTFYPAEEYHHDYYKKNPLHYKLYKKGSGREDYLKRQWGN